MKTPQYMIIVAAFLLLGMLFRAYGALADDVYLPECKSLIVQEDCTLPTENGPRFRLRR
jgi:hypothetical protein